MADSTLAALPAATSVEDADLMYLEQGGVSKKGTGLLVRGPKGNVTGSDPTVNSDATAGYSAGSTWVNSSTRSRWMCADPTATAAKWLLMDFADHPGYVANQFYLSRSASVATGSAMTLGIARFIPMVVKQRVTISALGVRCTTAGSAGAFVDLAIYAASAPGALQRPLTYIANTGSMVATSTGTLTATIAAQLEPGFYWLGINTNDSAIVCQTYSTTNSDMAMLIGGTTQVAILNSTLSLTSISTPLTFGTQGNLPGATWTEMVSTNYAAIAFKVGSVP